jgi:hypothetical protein
MKRSWCSGVWIGIAAVTILKAFVQPVMAATPAPTPTLGSLPKEFQSVTDGTPVTSISVSNSGSYPGLEPTINVNLQAQANDFKAPDFTKQDTSTLVDTLQRLEAGAINMTPKEVLAHYNDPPPEQEDYRYSGVFGWCNPSSGGTPPAAPQDVARIVTGHDDKEQLKRLFNVSGKIAAFLSPTYRLTPDENGNYIIAKVPSILAKELPPCDSMPTGTPMPQATLPLAEGNGIFAFLTRIFNQIFTPQGDPTKTSETLSATFVGIVKPDSENRSIKLLTGKESGNTTDLQTMPNDEKTKVDNDKGALTTFLPGNADLIHTEHATIDNFNVQNQAVPVNFYQGYLQEYDTNLVCAITSKQDPNRPANCDLKTVTTPPSTSSGDVCAVADEYHIPCCMLMGIMKNETNFGALPIPNPVTCSSQSTSKPCCSPKADGITPWSCGPANILCGQYSGFAGNDKPDMCTMEGTALLLARALRLKLCQAAKKCGTYDWTTSGTAAMDPTFDIIHDPTDQQELQSVINDILSYTATGYYYGMNNGCFPDYCTQYLFGPGKSYCDSIMNYCQTSTAPDYSNGQILPVVDDPQYCKLCNDNVYIPNHLPQLKCP